MSICAPPVPHPPRLVNNERVEALSDYPRQPHRQGWRGGKRKRGNVWWASLSSLEAIPIAGPTPVRLDVLCLQGWTRVKLLEAGLCSELALKVQNSSPPSRSLHKYQTFYIGSPNAQMDYPGTRVSAGFSYEACAIIVVFFVSICPMTALKNLHGRRCGTRYASTLPSRATRMTRSSSGKCGPTSSMPCVTPGEFKETVAGACESTHSSRCCVTLCVRMFGCPFVCICLSGRAYGHICMHACMMHVCVRVESSFRLFAVDGPLLLLLLLLLRSFLLVN